MQENLVQLCELQRDISGFDHLVQGDRKFIRQGCLQKYSRKGFQQWMFFLVSNLINVKLNRSNKYEKNFPLLFLQFSDVLLYTSRTQQPSQCFRVHGQLPLKGMSIQESDNKTGTDFAFVILGQGNQ